MRDNVVKMRDVVWQRCLDEAPCIPTWVLEPIWGRLLLRMYRPIQLPVIRRIGRGV